MVVIERSKTSTAVMYAARIDLFPTKVQIIRWQNNALVAQLAEQLTLTQKVASSKLAQSTNFRWVDRCNWLCILLCESSEIGRAHV